MACHMGLWNDYVVICINKYNYKGSKKYDGFYVIDFNFEKKVVKKYDRFYVIDFNFARVY